MSHSSEITVIKATNNMMEQIHFNKKAAGAWCLVLVLIIQQVTSSPVSVLEPSLGSLQKVEKLHRRTARMTPLWRIMGTKPHGAYCQNNYECSTGICRKGHCSFSQPINS